MNTTTRIILLLCAAAWFLTGCQSDQSPTAAIQPEATQAAPTTAATAEICPAQAVNETPDFAGTWITNEGNVLTITETQFYLRAIKKYPNEERTYVHETFADILEFDTGARTIKIRYKTLAVDGKAGGFDTPVHTIAYDIIDNTLRFGISQADSDIPEVTSDNYALKAAP